MPSLGRLTPQNCPIPILQEGGQTPAPVWTGAECLAPPTGFHPRTVLLLASRSTDQAIPDHYTFRRLMCLVPVGILSLQVIYQDLLPSGLSVKEEKLSLQKYSRTSFIRNVNHPKRQSSETSDVRTHILFVLRSNNEKSAITSRNKVLCHFY